MSRYYTVHGKSVYVYATEGDSLLDIRVIPEGVGLFSADVPWRASPRMAVSEEATDEAIGLLGQLLKTQGYGRVDVGLEALEEYFARGDERSLGLVAPPTGEAVAMHQWTLDDKPSARVRQALRRPARRRMQKPTPFPRQK